MTGMAREKKPLTRRVRVLALMLCLLASSCGGAGVAPEPEEVTSKRPESAARAPVLARGEAGLRCLEVRCFAVRGFPATTEDGAQFVLIDALEDNLSDGMSAWTIERPIFYHVQRAGEELTAERIELATQVDVRRFLDVVEDCCEDQQEDCAAPLCDPDPVLEAAAERELSAALDARLEAVEATLDDGVFWPMRPHAVSALDGDAPAPTAGSPPRVTYRVHELALDEEDEPTRLQIDVLATGAGGAPLLQRQLEFTRDAQPIMGRVQAWVQPEHRWLLIQVTFVEGHPDVTRHEARFMSASW